MSLFGAPAPRVFTLPPSVRFLEALAAQLWQAAGGDPLRLADMQVFLPTRRAARGLVEALAAQSPSGAALIAPSIRPLGDLDADEKPFEPAGPALEALPAIGEARRLFELARLAEAKMLAEGQARDAAAALAAAREIARLIDELETAEIDDLSGLDGDVRARLPEHLQRAAAFLAIIHTHWPARLKELGAADDAARRAGLLRALAAHWRDRPPAGPVIAAGSTGTAPAVAALLRVIARLPQGAVILPGLDRDLGDEAWAEIDDQHPQAQLKRLLDDLGVARADVADLPGVAEAPGARPRRRLVAQALLPAQASGGMLEGVRGIAGAQGMDPEAFAHAALDGLTLIEAKSEEEEALACSLALRGALEGAGTAMLVTPDTALAARVSARLSRWGVEAQSSSGRPLAETAPGAFLSLLLDQAREPESTLSLCALWKHPLCALGRTRPELRRAAARIERRFLRGPRPRDLRGAIAGDTHLEDARKAAMLALLDDTYAALAPLTALPGPAPAPQRAAALAESAEAFARAPDAEGAARVWAGEGGEGAAELVRELIADGDALPGLDAHDFARLFAEAMQGRAVRPRAGEHPRLRILGPLEARLQGADLVILAGLNEGVWPRVQTGEPFLSREMRRAVGLDAPERRIGQAAHDFAQGSGAGRVILSRSRRRDGAPAVASRFLWRLKTLAAGASGRSVEDAIAADPALALARMLDHVPAADAQPLTAGPRPTPPLAARPRKASATSLRLWVRDPYSVYARDILRLEALDPVDAAPGAAERGTAIHDALESCFDALAAEGGDQALNELEARGETLLAACGLAPEQLAFALPRFRRAARWLTAFEALRRAEGWVPVAAERRAEWKFDAPGGPFTVVAKADRIDARTNSVGGDATAIVDYKTGSAPSRDEVRAGFDLQMPVQAAMLKLGLFADAPAGAPESLLYLKLGGGAPPGEDIELTGGKEPWSGEDYAAFGADTVRRLVAFFDDPANPYPSQPRAKYVNDWGDYDHLARRGEWARADGGEE